MTDIRTEEVMAKYNEEERDYIVRTANIMAMFGMGNAPQTTEEFADWCEKTINNRKEAERKEAEKKARKIANEIAKAEAMGMTVEEYKEMKKVKAKKTRYNREIEEMKKAIAEMERKIAYREKWIAEN